MTEEAITSGETGDGGATTAAAATGAVTNETGATEQPWYSSFDEDTRGWMENRGLTKMDPTVALENAVKGFRNAEKYVGTPHEKLLTVPDFDKADKAELDQFYSKLGRPADAEKYELTVPEGQPTDFADFAKTMFHEAGLTDRQARLINDKWNDYVAGQGDAQVEQYQENLKQQDAALRKEWGEAYDDQIDKAKSAAREFGLQENQIDAMEKALGFDGLMKFMSNIGAKLGEDTFVTGGNGGGNFNGKMTPAGAQARIKQLQGDKEWSSKYIAGNHEARAEMERLMKAAYPDV
jgi:hypothetical protein